MLVGPDERIAVVGGLAPPQPLLRASTRALPPTWLSPATQIAQGGSSGRTMPIWRMTWILRCGFVCAPSMLGIQPTAVTVRSVARFDGSYVTCTVNPPSVPRLTSDEPSYGADAVVSTTM